MRKIMILNEEWFCLSERGQNVQDQEPVRVLEFFLRPVAQCFVASIQYILFPHLNLAYNE